MMTRNEICKAMREELKEIRHKALSADRDAIRIKELQEQLAVSTRGQDCSRAASSAHTFLASAVEGQAVRREYIQRELDTLQKERAACLDAVEQYKAVVRRCCFYYMYDVLEARYFNGVWLARSWGCRKARPVPLKNKPCCFLRCAFTDGGPAT